MPYSEKHDGDTQEPVRARIFMLIGAVSLTEVLIASWLTRNMQLASVQASFFRDMLLGLWDIFLITNWTLGYRKMFVKGVWFFKEKETLLAPTAKKAFYLFYIPHILSGAGVAGWSILCGRGLGTAVSAVKIGLIIWAWHRLFPGSS